MKKNLIICASQNSFFTIPPVKQLLDYFKTVSEISSIHSEINGYDDFFSGSKYHNVVNNYTDYASYNGQTRFEKVSKYFKVSILLFFQIFRNLFRFDTVYIYSCELYIIYVAIILKSKKIKIIYHQFEMMIPNDLNKIDQFLLKRIIKRFKKVDLAIFPEENRKVYFRDMLLKYSDNQFFVLPNTNNNMVSENYSRQNDKIRIAHIGAVGSNHHITSYLKAIKELPKDKFEFLFVGMLNNDIRDMILKENFQNIIITGQIPHNDLKEIYLNIDIGVILYKDVSLHTRFCAPNKLYEFWSYGIPVVGDVLPGLISVFKEKEQGILIDMTQPNEICDAFLRLGALDEHKRNDILRIFNSTYRLDVYLDRIDEILSLSSDN